MTHPAVHRQRLDALHSLATRIAASPAGGPFADALDHLFGPTTARAGIALLNGKHLEIVAEHGLSGIVGAPDLREAIGSIAARAIDERRALRIADVRIDRVGLSRVGEIAAIGCTAALAVPLLLQRRVLGAFVLMFPPLTAVDEETTLFVETIAALAAPALAGQFGGDDRSAQLKGPATTRGHEALGSATLLGASVGHELEGPVGALSLQLEEQQRIVSDLQVFSEGGDTPLGGAISELAELTDELQVTVARLRETTDQLTRLGHRELAPCAIDLADIARQACLVARPGFEERGIVLEMQLSEGGYVSGHKQSLLQVVSDLLLLARDHAEFASAPPRVIVRTANEGSRVVLAVDALGPVPDRSELRDFERRPFADVSTDEKRRLVLKLLGDVVSSHGGHVELLSLDPARTRYRVILPAFGASEPSQPRSQATVQDGSDHIVRHVLVVDDDPVFSRAARRAIKPHLVREATTASEAELILTDPGYLPDLVICDIMLPGADGTTLHRRIVDKRPEAAGRFLFVTGGTLGKETADYIRHSGCGALRKPIDLSAVRRHLSNPHRDTVTTSIVRTLRQEF